MRTELAPIEDGRRTYLPPSCFTLTKDEKLTFCNSLAEVKVPQGYSSNICNFVSMEELKLFGMKSHDCHILMQQLLPVAIESILSEGVKNAITRMCVFFNILCCKVVDNSRLDALQNEIVMTLCLFEKYFPPSFFDIMVHLTVHLVREVKLGGPVYLRWMYPFERYMKVLKGYVRNRNRPEGCIVESYIVEEAIEFCSEYLHDVKVIGIPRDINDDLNTSMGITIGSLCRVERYQLNQAHRNVLQNTNEVQPLIE